MPQTKQLKLQILPSTSGAAMIRFFLVYSRFHANAWMKTQIWHYFDIPSVDFLLQYGKLTRERQGVQI